MNEPLPDTPAPGPQRFKRAAVAVLSLALMAVVLSPVAQNFRAEPRDDFPLSYFPMFSFKRKATKRITYIIGHDARGFRVRIPYRYAGSGGFNQVRKQLTRRARRRREARKLCRDIARRLLRDDDPRFAKVVRVSIMRGEFDVERYFFGHKQPRWKLMRASCTVPR